MDGIIKSGIPHRRICFFDDISDFGKVLSQLSPLGGISYFFQINSDLPHLPIESQSEKGYHCGGRSRKYDAKIRWHVCWLHCSNFFIEISVDFPSPRILLDNCLV